MIEHVAIPVRSVKKALAPLGYKQKYDWGSAIGYMEGGHTSFIIVEEKKVVPTFLIYVSSI